jgi:hypothetical protein
MPSGGKDNILYVFYMNNCDHSKSLIQTIDSNMNLFIDCNVIKVDFDDPNNEHLFKEYRINCLPSIIFIKNDGSIYPFDLGENNLPSIDSILEFVKI